MWILDTLRRGVQKIRRACGQATNWIADKVQTSTGEKERCEGVAYLKKLAKEFETKVTEAISLLNPVIEKFNAAIKKLNTIRNTKVKENIGTLFNSLMKFGNCKPIGTYVAEEEMPPAEFPVRELDVIENYIKDVDWSKDDVFLDTFFLSPIGMKMKTRKQNLSMRESIHELQMKIDSTVEMLRARKSCTEQEIKICSMYISNIEYIQSVISNKILPELKLVEAFLEAEKIKNEILANNVLEKMKFNYNVKHLEKTIYHRHYQFVKNTVAFYIISCRIYNTPVLTNLLNNKATDKDIEQLGKEHKLLEYQSKELNNSMVIQKEVDYNASNR